MPIETQERRSCNDAAFKCFGTAYIFEQRAVPLRIGIKILAFSSLIGPLSIGVVVLSTGASGKLFISAVVAASVLSVIQIIVSLWALVSHWSENLNYYLESKVDNYHLSDKFKDLANNTIFLDEKWRHKYEVLDTLGTMRSQADHKYDITDEEKRMGMRAALRNFQRSCVGCSEIPKSTEPTECTVCGAFKRKKLKWLM